MIVLWAQAYYVPGLSKDSHIISPQGICTQEEYKGNFISHCHFYHDSHAKLNSKEKKLVRKETAHVEKVYIKYDSKNNLPTHKYILPNQREKEVKVLESAVCVTNGDNQNLPTSQK